MKDDTIPTKLIMQIIKEVTEKSYRQGADIRALHFSEHPSNARRKFSDVGGNSMRFKVCYLVKVNL